MKDVVLFSVTKIVDDDTGIWAGCDYDFSITAAGLRHCEHITPEAVEQLRKMANAAIDSMTKKEPDIVFGMTDIKRLTT